MLRLAVLMLLVLNLLYFGWTHSVGSEEPRLQAVAIGPRTAPLPPPPKPPCATFGPFAEEAQTARVQQQLEAAGWGVVPRKISSQVADGYWVTVDDLGNAATQTRVLNAIKRAGIEDAFAMPGDPGFRVSVGIFTDRSRAEGRATRVRRLNLEAQVNDRMREVSTQWLDVPGVAARALADGRLAAAGVSLDGITIEACP